MAVTPRDTDEAFLREVDEGVRRDQVQSLWKRYGALGITVLVLLLGSLGGWLYWQDARQRAAGVAGEAFTQAIAKLEVGDGAAARPVLERLAREGPGGYSGLARMTQAADAMAGGDVARATRLLDAVAADAAQSQAVRDAALIKSVRMWYDTASPAAVIARLQPLAVPGNPWFGVAGEMTALAHLRAGAPDKAKPLLTAIVRDNALPASLRGRAAELALSLGVDPAALQLPGGATAPAA